MNSILVQGKAFLPSEVTYKKLSIKESLINTQNKFLKNYLNRTIVNSVNNECIDYHSFCFAIYVEDIK